MIELLLGPFDLDRSVSRRLDVVLGAFRPGEIPLGERSARLATALGIGKLDAIVTVLTVGGLSAHVRFRGLSAVTLSCLASTRAAPGKIPTWMLSASSA